MTPDLQPTLQSDALLLRPVRESDWQALFAVAADAELWAQHPASDRYQEPVFRQFFDEALAAGSAFVVIDRASNRIIGSSRYNDFDPAIREIEIGWTILSRDYWGGDTNRELKSLMLEHAFGFVETVVFWVGDSNRRSRRALEKIGARCRDGLVERGGSPHVVYEISRNDWLR